MTRGTLPAVPTHTPTSLDHPLRATGASYAPRPRPDTVEVLGVPLARIDYDGVLAWIDAMVAARERGYVCVAATHTVMASREDEELRAAVLGSSLTVPDGQPLVWAMNALGARLGARVYGPTLMERAMAHTAGTPTRHFLYGGRNQGALVQLAYNLRSRHPGVRIVGGHVPPFRPLTESEQESVAADIDRSGADVVWVGIGVPAVCTSTRSMSVGP